MLAIRAALFFTLAFVGSAGAGQLSTGGYLLLTERALANTSRFFVYQTMDSGFNHGVPSGFFGNSFPTINAACVDDPNASTGCATDVASLDKSGTRFQLSFKPMTSGQFGGLNFVEPQGYVVSTPSYGYDLSGTSQILFSARSPSGVTLQFGAGGATTEFVTFSPSRTNYQTVCIAIQGNAASVCPSGTDFALNLQSPMDLSDVHILFAIDTNNPMAPRGGTILLDQIQYAPFPPKQLTVPSLPLSTQTFGIVPVQIPQSGRVPVPPDQVNRNVSSLYESALSELALFARGEANDMAPAFGIANSLVYALGHDNQGEPLPPPSGGGLHNAYESGDLPLLNSQGTGAGQAGQIRLAGFSASFCKNTGYCLVLDGATGGNNAFAILALLKAYSESGRPVYLSAAIRIGDWIYGQLRDTTGTGYGGYFAGYPDAGQAKVLEKGKSTENNADIFAAFTALAAVEAYRNDAREATVWTKRAKLAGDFVIAMFDSSRGCFNAGTVPQGTTSGPGVTPTGPSRGNDVINASNFLDSNSFTYLALAPSAQYGKAISWARVAACLSQFRETVQAGGITFSGYDIVSNPTAGPNGIAWEFTGQAAVVTKLSGGNATPIINALLEAQAKAPFGDRNGLVAATLQGQNAQPPYDPPPYEQCLSTPFQCIPERVGIAATSWGIFAETGYNPLQWK